MPGEGVGVDLLVEERLVGSYAAGRAGKHMPLLVVDVASMRELHDDDQQDLVLDCVDDAVVA